MDESRKQFEEFIYRYFGKDILIDFAIRKCSDGDYISPRTMNLWQAWQASREAMNDV